MKNITYLVSILVLVVFLTGCDDYDYKEPVKTLFVVESDLDFPATGGTGTIVTTSGKGAVTARSNKEWCTTTVSGTTVTVSVSAHTEIVNRTALVTILSGDESVEVPVTQAPMLFIIDQFSIDVTWRADTYEIPVTSGLPITVTSEVGWISPTVSGDNLLIEVAENPYTQSRSGNLTVKSGEVEQTFVVAQEPRLLVYAELLGEWTLHCTNTSGTTEYEFDLVFKQKTAGSVYTVSGWPGDCDYDLTFNSQTCGLTLAMGQYAFKHENGIWDMILMAYDTALGTVTWNAAIQLGGTWNLNAANPEYTFADNGTWSNYVVRAIGLGNFSNGTFQGSIYNAVANLRIVKK